MLRQKQSQPVISAIGIEVLYIYCEQKGFDYKNLHGWIIKKDKG